MRAAMRNVNAGNISSLRSPGSRTFRTGLIGMLLTAMVVASAQFYDKVPLLGAHRTYAGMFGDTGGLKVGDDVAVAGVKVGQVEKIAIDGPAVKITFHADGVKVRELSRLSIKTRTVLGTKYLDVQSRGRGFWAPTRWFRSTAPTPHTCSPTPSVT